MRPTSAYYQCMLVTLVREDPVLAGKSRTIRRGDGSEYISRKLTTWEENKGIKLKFIQSDKSQ